MLKKIKLTNYRNHDNLEINLNLTDLYILGPNGSGKTNILEAIYLILTTKSFKTSNYKEIISYGVFTLKVEIKYDDDTISYIVNKDEKLIFK